MPILLISTERAFLILDLMGFEPTTSTLRT